MAFSTVLHEYEVLVCSSLYNVQCPWQFMSSCLGCGNYTCYYHVASCLHDRHIRTLRLFQRELHIPCVLLIWLWVQITTHSTERNPVDYHCLLDHARYVGSLQRHRGRNGNGGNIPTSSLRVDNKKSSGLGNTDVLCISIYEYLITIFSACSFLCPVLQRS